MANEKKVEIIYKKVDELVPYANNPRKNKKAIQKVADSIKEFGFVNPIILDGHDTIICGHTRLEAAKLLDMEEVPCIIKDDLTDDQVKAFRIIDNRTGEFSEWDEDKLRAEIQSMDFDFSRWELEQYSELDIHDDVKEDEYIVEPPKNPRTKIGEVWKLGRHRLVCGDCGSEENLNKLFKDEQADLIVTDPPYNVNYGDKAKMLEKYEKGHRNTDSILNDDMSEDKFLQFLSDKFVKAYQYAKDGCPIYVFHADTHRKSFEEAFTGAGFKLAQNLIWVKNTLVLGRQDYQWRHEPILYGWKEGAAHYFINDRTQTTVLDDNIDIDKLTKDELKQMIKEYIDGQNTILYEDKPTLNDLHPTMKPVKLVARLVENSARKNDIVFDGFAGSGSVCIACEQLERKCYMAELEPAYCDVIIDRWEKFTGLKAEKEE